MVGTEPSARSESALIQAIISVAHNVAFKDSSLSFDFLNCDYKLYSPVYDSDRDACIKQGKLKGTILLKYDGECWMMDDDKGRGILFEKQAVDYGQMPAIHKNDISQRTFQEIKNEIASYKDVAKAIINLAVYGKYQNRSYERLELLVDTVGPRLSGSKNLEKAIQMMYQNLQQDGLENVHLEPVKIPHWERGEESAVMLLPRIHKMAILGLGSSIGTPPG
ncbi:hypothetical protein STEG23_035697, partial [Scotinomys teguina]